MADRSEDRAAVRAVSLLFLGNGLTFSSLLPRLPDVRTEFGIGLDTLGILLMAASVGGIVGSWAGGWASTRMPPRRFALTGALLLGVAMPVLGLAPTPIAFGVWAFLLGAVDATADMGMNLLATDLDRRSSRSLIHRFHAIWSVGTLFGAGIGSLGGATEVDLAVQLAAVAVVQVGLALAGAPGLPRGVGTPSTVTPRGPAGDGRQRRPARLRTTLAVLAGTAAAMAYVEGVPSEWAGLFGTDVHGQSTGAAGLGYAAFTIGMVLGRFGGDHLTDRLGPDQVQTMAFSVAGFGALLVVTSPVPEASLPGFLLAGLGASVLFPALYLRATSMGGLSPGAGLAAMSTGLRIGFLSSPVVVGVLAERHGLRVAVAVVMALALLGGSLLGRAGRSPT